MTFISCLQNFPKINIALIALLFFLPSCDQGERVSLNLADKLEWGIKFSNTNRIDFNDRDAKEYLRSGWSYTEAIENGNSAIWANERIARLIFRVFEIKDKVMIMRIEPFNYPDAEPQMVKVSVNWNKISDLTLKQGFNCYEVNIPASILKRGENVILFEFSHLKRPIEVGMGKDGRTLAARFDYILFIDQASPHCAEIKERCQKYENLKENLNNDDFSIDLSSSTIIQPANTEWWFYSNTGKKPLLELFFSNEKENYGFDRFKINLTTLKDGKEETINLISFENRIKENKKKIKIPLIENSLCRLEFRVEGNFPQKGVQYAGKVHFYKEKIGSKEKTKFSIHKGKNLVIILLDALRASAIGSYGESTVLTPFLDEIQRKSLNFYNCYSVAPYTKASIPAIFTGYCPWELGVLDVGDKLPDSYLTLAELLQQAGYTTAAFSSIPFISKDFGMEQGFSEFFELWRDKAEPINADEITHQFIKWLTSEKKSPFFAYIHIREPHDPYETCYPIKGLYSEDKNLSVNRDYLEKMERGEIKLRPGDQDKIYRRYLENLTFADLQLSKLFRTMANLNLIENTIFIITSDHGEAFLEHGKFFHNSTTYEEMIKIPLFLFPSNLFAEFKSSNFKLVQNVDIMPTILDLFGIIPPHRINITGRNILRENETRNMFFSRSAGKDFSLYSASDGKYKLIFSSFYSIAELYNLENDPAERKDIFQNEPFYGYYFLNMIRENIIKYEKEALKRAQKVKLDKDIDDKLKGLGYIK